MAYSRSEDTLKQRLPDLVNVSQGRAQKWDTTRFGRDRAWWWAGKIREALYIAREVFPGKYPELARIARTFTVEVLDANTVQARPMGNTPVSALGAGEGRSATSTEISDVTPIHGLELAGSVPRQITGMKTATDIISWCLRAFPTNDKLVFTEAPLSDEELDMLARWASKQTPAWMVVVSRSNDIVTLSPHQPGIKAWPVKPLTIDAS